MKSLDELLEKIRSSESYRNVATAVATLKDRDDLLAQYQSLLTTQKQLVRAQASHQSKRIETLQNDYQQKLSEIERSPLVSLYLDNLSELDELIQAIGEIINSGINS